MDVDLIAGVGPQLAMSVFGNTLEAQVYCSRLTVPDFIFGLGFG